jgi:hypothetical protein
MGPKQRAGAFESIALRRATIRCCDDGKNGTALMQNATVPALGADEFSTNGGAGLYAWQKIDPSWLCHFLAEKWRQVRPQAGIDTVRRS